MSEDNPSMMIELDIEQLNVVATAVVLRIDEIMRQIPKEIRTKETQRELEVLIEFNELLHDVENEYNVVVDFDKVMREAEGLLDQ